MGDMSLRAVGWAQSFPVSGGVRQGRVWAREHLDALGWTRQAPDTVDAVLLTVSELITNAHVHAHSTAQLVLAWDSQCLHVSVHDSSTELPAQREAGASATSGRGLALIEHFADSYETYHQRSGKTVTACFTPSDQPQPHAADQRDESAAER